MPPQSRALNAAVAIALLPGALTACRGEPADAPRDAPNPSQLPSTPAAVRNAAVAPTPPTPPAMQDEPQAPPGAQVPAAYLGQWQRTGTSCATRDETRLRIEAQRVTFHESSGTVQAADAEDGRLTLTLRMTGEGQTRDATYRFGLSNDGRWLTDLENDLVRERCP